MIEVDWRNRKYYVARFSLRESEYRLRILKLISGVRIHCPTQLTSGNWFKSIHDETEPRGYYHYLIGCPTDVSEAVEFELRKSQRFDDNYNTWKEIKQKLKLYSPYAGFPERRCDLRSRKRCAHCGDC